MTTLEKYLAKQDKIIKEDRERTLISLGLFEKEYSPDQERSWKYDKIDYRNGEKVYYREIPISVSDEEYSLILKKAAQVEAIKAKEEEARSKEATRHFRPLVKTWVPVFQRQNKKDDFNNHEEATKAGRSPAASSIRIFKWIIIIGLILAGIIAMLFEKFWILPVSGFTASLFATILEGFASLLDNQAEQLAILKSGFKYLEK